MLYWIAYFKDFTGKLARRRLRFSESGFHVVHYEAIKHQAVDNSTRLKTTKTDRTPFEDYVPAPCITSSMSLEKREARFWYVKNHDVINDKEGIGFLAKYSIPIYTGIEYHKSRKNVQESLQEQAKNTNCRQALSTSRLTSLTFHYDSNGFSVCNAPIYEAVHNVVPTSLKPHLLNHPH